MTHDPTTDPPHPSITLGERAVTELAVRRAELLRSGLVDTAELDVNTTGLHALHALLAYAEQATAALRDAEQEIRMLRRRVDRAERAPHKFADMDDLTVDDLDALPSGSVIQDYSGEYWSLARAARNGRHADWSAHEIHAIAPGDYLIDHRSPLRLKHYGADLS